MFKKRLSKEEALQKLRHYCGYQERCHREVKEKLYSFGLNKQDVEDAISVLIEENYLNEERFAIAYAGGYFRSKQWGRVKIGYELKQKGVSEYCIKKAMKEIPEDDYLNTIRELITKKSDAIEDDGLNQYARRQKIINYLLQRGFESQLIQKELKNDSEGENP